MENIYLHDFLQPGNVVSFVHRIGDNRVSRPREVIYPMSYRTFVDRDGSYWQVWDSQPTKVERRLAPGDRRQGTHRRWSGTERRSGADRRTINQRRITLSEGYGRGWLTFESLQEKRRLIPIPSHWEDLSNGELRALCDKARPVSRTEGTGTADQGRTGGGIH